MHIRKRAAVTSTALLGPVPGLGKRILHFCPSAVEVTQLHFFTMISTRRFFCRPSGLSLPSRCVLGATGFALPQPLVVIGFPSTPPCWTSQAFTAIARCSDSRRL